VRLLPKWTNPDPPTVGSERVWLPQQNDNCGEIRSDLSPELIQTSAGDDVAEPRPSRRTGLPDPNGMELTLQIAAPEFEKPAQFGEIGGKVELLPDKALQQIRMIRQMVDDLGRRQPIIAQLVVLLVAQFRALVRPILPRTTSIGDKALRHNGKNKVKQVISSNIARLLPPPAKRFP